MAKSLFNIGVHWGDRQRTIQEVAHDLWIVLYSLSKVDKVFRKAVLSVEGFNDVEFEIKEELEIYTIEEIALSILLFSKTDILAYEKLENPTVNYSRPFGFSFGVTFYEGDKKCVSFIPRMGSSEGNGFASISFSREFIKDFDWYFKVLKTLVSSNNAEVGVVGLQGLANVKLIQTLYPLGWITYFSNECKLDIPNNLEGIEYEYSDGGKYLILAREDFTIEKETYELFKDKLLNLMKRLRETVYGYAYLV